MFKPPKYEGWNEGHFGANRGPTRSFHRHYDLFPGAPTPLAKVPGVIVTVRVVYRAAAGCEAPPPLSPAQRKIFRCLGVKRPVSEG